MYEVEVKVEADIDRVRQRLDELGAEHVDSVEQVDTYYDAPHREFAETDEAFRVREETTDGDTETRITYKGPLVEDDSKTRQEFETRVADSETMRSIAESLGFDPAATVRKNRDRYAIQGFIVTLDSVDGVGEFVEVETDVESEAAVENAREAAFDLLREIGLDPDDQTRTSYLGLLLASNTQE